MNDEKKNTFDILTWFTYVCCLLRSLSFFLFFSLLSSGCIAFSSPRYVHKLETDQPIQIAFARKRSETKPNQQQFNNRSERMNQMLRHFKRYMHINSAFHYTHFQIHSNRRVAVLIIRNACAHNSFGISNARLHFDKLINCLVSLYIEMHKIVASNRIENCLSKYFTLNFVWFQGFCFLFCFSDNRFTHIFYWVSFLNFHTFPFIWPSTGNSFLIQEK